MSFILISLHFSQCSNSWAVACCEKCVMFTGLCGPGTQTRYLGTSFVTHICQVWGKFNSCVQFDIMSRHALYAWCPFSKSSKTELQREKQLCPCLQAVPLRWSVVSSSSFVSRQLMQCDLVATKYLLKQKIIILCLFGVINDIFGHFSDCVTVSSIMSSRLVEYVWEHFMTSELTGIEPCIFVLVVQ